LQEQREGEEVGRERTRPLLHQRIHHRGQNTLLFGHERHIRNLVFVSTVTRSCGRLSGAAWPRSNRECLSAHSYAGYGASTLLPPAIKTPTLIAALTNSTINILFMPLSYSVLWP
jgi:hypothetical protein